MPDASLTAPDHTTAATREAFARSMRARDADAAGAVYALDARLLPPAAAPVKGRIDISRYWQAGFDSGVADIQFQPEDVRERDGLAYELGRYVLHVESSDGAVVVERGHYVHIYERQPGGSWQRAVEIFSPGGEGG